MAAVDAAQATTEGSVRGEMAMGPNPGGAAGPLSTTTGALPLAPPSRLMWELRLPPQGSYPGGAVSVLVALPSLSPTQLHATAHTAASVLGSCMAPAAAEILTSFPCICQQSGGCCAEASCAMCKAVPGVALKPKAPPVPSTGHVVRRGYTNASYAHAGYTTFGGNQVCLVAPGTRSAGMVALPTLCPPHHYTATAHSAACAFVAPAAKSATAVCGYAPCPGATCTGRHTCAAEAKGKSPRQRKAAAPAPPADAEPKPRAPSAPPPGRAVARRSYWNASTFDRNEVFRPAAAAEGSQPPTKAFARAAPAAGTDT
eukprot:RCo045511